MDQQLNRDAIRNEIVLAATGGFGNILELVERYVMNRCAVFVRRQGKMCTHLSGFQLQKMTPLLKRFGSLGITKRLLA